MQVNHRILLSAPQVLGAKIDDEPAVEDEQGYPETSKRGEFCRTSNGMLEFCRKGQPRWPLQHGRLQHELQPDPR